MQGTSSARTAADVGAELEGLEREQDRLRHERDLISKSQASRWHLPCCTDLCAAREELQQAHNARREKEKLTAQAREAEEEVAVLGADLAELEGRLAPAQEARERSVREREERRKAQVKEERAVEEDLRVCRVTPRMNCEPFRPLLPSTSRRFSRSHTSSPVGSLSRLLPTAAGFVV